MLLRNPKQQLPPPPRPAEQTKPASDICFPNAPEPPGAPLPQTGWPQQFVPDKYRANDNHGGLNVYADGHHHHNHHHRHRHNQAYGRGHRHRRRHSHRQSGALNHPHIPPPAGRKTPAHTATKYATLAC